MNSKTLPSIRISVNTLENIERAITKYNETNLIKLSKQEFRRLSYEILSQLILNNRLKDVAFVISDL